jgi:glycosyltransferase involved in cell wall biosynthesis
VKNPKISVIIPVFNKEKFLGRCMRSIFSQTVNKEDYEVILIDDGSTDRSVKVLERYLSDIVLITHDVNKGLPAALNSGIRAARGQFIVRLDADDYAHEEYLNILALTLRMDNKIDAVACDYILVDEKQDQISNVNCLEHPIGCAIMYRIEHLIDLGLYDETFLVHEDKDLRIRFDQKYNLTRVPIPLYRYFIHGDNLTSNDKMMVDFERVLDQKHGS